LDAQRAASAAIPIIDIGPLLAGAGGDAARVAREIRDACVDAGFFYVVGHGVDPALVDRLERASRRFFALAANEKAGVAMARGGRAWRGYFAVGDELTSGRPDRKEGLYFGAELDARHPRVRAGTPLHGANLFPAQVPELREAVLAYMAALTAVGHALMGGISLSLGLAPSYLRERHTDDPLALFRIFNYPAAPAAETDDAWGVGEHTDYGLLTILLQDGAGGLQVKTPAGWVDAPPLAHSFVCNVGDMLDRMTSGLYHSTPHRVRNASGRDRLSFPFFFDPSWDARIAPLPGVTGPAERAARWDGADVHAATEATYGEYILAKVARVFPALTDDVM
jgi:isopenicillin N synthase-like dioxygenase